MLFRHTLLSAVVIATQPFPVQGQDRSPAEVFSAFRSAVGEGKVEQAALLLSDETVAWYEKLRWAALTATEAHLETLPTTQVLGILSLRHHFSKTELKATTGRMFLAKALMADPASAKALDRIEVEGITYKRDVAVANIRHNRKPAADVVLTFRKQGGTWKWDLAQYSEQAAARFEAMRQDAGLGKAAFGMRLLRTQYGSQVSEEITKRARE
jgi:hypothetical protein